jgi:hypothetical protein
MPEETVKMKGLKPLNITCTSTDCERNLHCFRMTKKLLASGPGGRCRSCGVQLVDWPRVHKRNLEDVTYTFDALRLELIRHHFWHIPLTPKALNYARRKGRLLLRRAIENQIRQLVGREKHPREGIQTPRETSPNANAIHFAQHATASCCRRCLAEWHGIPEGRALSDEEIGYLTRLASMYLERRIPDLSDGPVAVPSVRKPVSKRGPELVGTMEHQNAS